MKIFEPDRRLDSLWGLIDQQHNEQIAARISGRRVLDVGAGYGSLVAFLRERGLDVDGIEPDEASLAASRRRFGELPIRAGWAEALDSYDEGTFDTIILKDSFHHLWVEGDPAAAMNSFLRVLTTSGRVIIWDPHPTAILRIARRLIRHDDPEGPRDAALSYLREQGFNMAPVTYFETLGLALSGGYVGPRWVPNWRPLNQSVAGLNSLFSRLMSSVGLAPIVCWRYLVYGDRGSVV